MTEIYRFFNSTTSDVRKYHADDFADYFAQFLSDGLYHQDEKPKLLAFSNGMDRNTYVEEGSAIIKGHMYKNTSTLSLTHELSHPTLNRIDRIVLRYDNRTENRFIKLFILKGEANEYPVPPQLTRDDTVYEMSLAQVLVRANTNVLKNEDYTDERLNTEVCGLTSSLISIPLDEMRLQFDQFKDGLNTTFYNWFDQNVRFSSVELLQDEVRMLKQNQIELLMQRYLENQSTDMDAGYFFDVLKDKSKIDEAQTTATIDTINLKAKLPQGSLQGQVTWKPHEIGFVTNKVRHFHTRPVYSVIPLTQSAPSGQNVINVANINVSIVEVE